MNTITIEISNPNEKILNAIKSLFSLDPSLKYEIKDTSKENDLNQNFQSDKNIQNIMKFAGFCSGELNKDYKTLRDEMLDARYGK
ncbi:MAG: hypothetical protein GX282_02025 [Campylobacteraceae bacterium]|nr:hypothetical protein [Campylobacteraceae bacterium]